MFSIVLDFLLLPITKGLYLSDNMGNTVRWEEADGFLLYTCKTITEKNSSKKLKRKIHCFNKKFHQSSLTHIYVRRLK